MPKFKVEYKSVKQEGDSVETKYVKTIAETASSILNIIPTEFADDLQFLTIRQIKDKAIKPKPEVKK